MWMSWNMFCKWQFWGRTLILLLSQQPLARLQVFSLKKTITSFQRPLCWLILAVRSHCLEWPLPVVAFCRCKSPGGLLWFHRKHFSLHHLKRSDVENLPEDPAECMWLSPLELNFPEQWHWAFPWEQQGNADWYELPPLQSTSMPIGKISTTV